jgi:hypothetical protein
VELLPNHIPASALLPHWAPFAVVACSLQDLSLIDGDWQRLPEVLLRLPLTRLHLRYADFADGEGELCPHLWHYCGGMCMCVCMLCVHAAVLLNTIVHTSMHCQVAYLLTSQRVHLVCVCLCRTLAAPRCWQAGEHPARPHPARLPDHVGSERDSTGATARPSDGLPACPPACTNCVQPSRLRHAALFLQHGA